MPIKTYKGAKAKADRLFSECIRSIGYCEAEGYPEHRPITCSKQLQTAHICSRRYSATRTDTRNAFALCFAHHRHFHDHPREFSHFITSTWAAQYYDAVYSKAVTPTKINWTDRVEFLNRIKQGELTLDEARHAED